MLINRFSVRYICNNRKFRESTKRLEHLIEIQMFAVVD